MSKRRPTVSDADREIGRALVARAIGGVAQPSSRKNHPDRFANIVVGALFFLASAALLTGVAWIASRYVHASDLWLFGVVSPTLGAIGLLGLSMMIQGVRNRPGTEGFFYLGLLWLGKRITPFQATFVPLVPCMVLMMQGLVSGNLHAMKSGFTAALLWTTTFVQLFLHEVGHLVAVRRAGLPFVRLAAGPVALVPSDDVYRFVRNERWINFFIGAVYYEVREKPSARKTLSVAAGGPMATACIGLFALAVRIAHAENGGWFVNEIAAANVAVAGGLLFVNLVPVRLGRMETDGFQIWRAWRSLRKRG